jgi:hypothetical protein
MAGNVPATMAGSLGWVYHPTFGWALDYVSDTGKLLNGVPGSSLAFPTIKTVSFWFYLHAIAGVHIFLANTDAGETQFNWLVDVYDGNLSFFKTTAGNMFSVAVSANTPYHVTYTVDEVSGYDGYVNGKSIGHAAWGASQNVGGTFHVGKWSGYSCNGLIGGDIRFYNRRLSPAEVWQLYDPITRWDLYKPSRRIWTAKSTSATPPPSAPTTLTATAVSSSQINLAWVDTSADETGFKIQRSLDGVTFTAYDTAAADATTYNDVACAANTRYWYKVCATNGGGDSAYTSAANAKTAPDAASKHYKFLFIGGGQVEQSDGRYLAFEKDVPPPGVVAGITWLYSEVGGALTGSRIHLPAGSAAAKGGPLKFDSGALLATPEAGSMEFYDGRWYITGTAKQRVIDRTGGVIVATTTVANSDVETTLWTEALSANAMRVGRIYKLRTNGVASNASAADDLTFNIYFGTTLLVTYNPAMGALAANAPWVFDSTIVIRTVGAPGSCVIYSDVTIGGSTSMFSALVAVDTTVATGITLKVQWDAAKAANTISIYQGYLELKN